MNFSLCSYFLNRKINEIFTVSDVLSESKMSHRNQAQVKKKQIIYPLNINNGQ